MPDGKAGLKALKCVTKAEPTCGPCRTAYCLLPRLGHSLVAAVCARRAWTEVSN
jgi:hypothetical protein